MQHVVSIGICRRVMRIVPLKVTPIKINVGMQPVGVSAAVGFVIRALWP